MNGLGHRDSSFVAIMKSVLNFIDAFQMKHRVSFLASQMVDIVNDMVAFESLTSNSCQTYYYCILIAKFSQQRAEIIYMIEQIDRE